MDSEGEEGKQRWNAIGAFHDRGDDIFSVILGHL